jgi:hypothetical protein
MGECIKGSEGESISLAQKVRIRFTVSVGEEQGIHIANKEQTWIYLVCSL